MRRRWAPERSSDSLRDAFHRRSRHSEQETLDTTEPESPRLAVIDPGAASAIAQVTLVGLVLASFVLVLLTQFVWLTLLTFLGIVPQALFRDRWVVEAAADNGEVHRWQVTGWRAGGDKIAEVRERLRAGVPPDGAGT